MIRNSVRVFVGKIFDVEIIVFFNFTEEGLKMFKKEINDNKKYE